MPRNSPEETSIDLHVECIWNKEMTKIETLHVRTMPHGKLEIMNNGVNIMNIDIFVHSEHTYPGQGYFTHGPGGGINFFG